MLVSDEFTEKHREKHSLFKTKGGKLRTRAITGDPSFAPPPAPQATAHSGPGNMLRDRDSTIFL